MKTWLYAIKMLTLHSQNRRPCTSLGADMHFLLHARMLSTLHSQNRRPYTSLGADMHFLLHARMLRHVAFAKSKIM